MTRVFVLDTSVFVNPASGQAFGRSPTDAFSNFLDQARRRPELEFLMPPSIYAELMHFAEESKIPKELLLAIHQRAPKKHELRVPGIFVYTLVENMRDRIDRGLRLAERHVREALHAPPSESASADRPIRSDLEAIGRLRESYRRIMREGSLDSRADVDLLLLAYETSGCLVSADAGVVLWAEALGISILPHDQLPSLIGSDASRPSSPG